MRTPSWLCIAAVAIGMSASVAEANGLPGPVGSVQDRLTLSFDRPLRFVVDDKASPSEALQLPAKIDIRELRLEDALKSLHRASGVALLFSPDFVPDVDVACECSDETVETALRRLLAGTNLELVASGDQVIIAPRNDLSDALVPTLPRISLPDALPALAPASRKLVRSGRVTSRATGTITGAVTSETGEPLAGVTVIVVGTNLGGLTGPDGRYTIANVPEGDHTVQARSVGYTDASRTVTIAAGETTNLDIQLLPAVIVLDEMVVTAIGVERDRRTLGYSITRVSADDIVQATEANLANLLQGQVAGVSVTPTSGLASSSRVVIRGVSTIDGQNQPLYVVDGVPIDNRVVGGRYSGNIGMWGGADGGDGLTSLNAGDIESMTVLRGASAAALYGERAKDGVILITTKRGGAGRVQVSVRNTTTFESLIVGQQDFQNQYGQGNQGRRPTTALEAHDWNGLSWGQRFDGAETIQWDGVPRPYSHLGDQAREFYRTGASLDNSVTVAGGAENATYYFSASNLGTTGIVPTQDLSRTSLTLRGTATIGRLNADVRANYIDETINNRTQMSDNPGNMHLQIVRLAKNVPLSSAAEGVYLPDGRANSLFPGTFVPNPYFVVNEWGNRDSRDRLIGHVRLDYNLTNWLVVTGRTGLDYYDQRRTEWRGWGTEHAPGGNFAERDIKVRERNTDLYVSGTYNLTPSLAIDAMAGGALRNTQDEVLGFNGDNYIFPGLNTIGNLAQVNPVFGVSEKEIRSFYGAFNLGYRDYLFLNLTGRNDWTSTLPVANNSFFYPSVAGSFIFSERFESALPNWLSYGQLRASWAEVGADTDPYQLDLTYAVLQPSFDGRIRAQVGPGTIPFADLKPAITRELELGTDIRFFDDRLGFDFAWYDRQTINQILSANISVATGYGGRRLNIGRIDNKGFEVLATAVPVARSDYSWRSSLNYARNRSIVTELMEGSERLGFESSRTQTAQIVALEGEEFGLIEGRPFKRDASGNLLLDAAGLPQGGDLTILGRGTPSWTGGWSNTLSYRGLSLNALVDIQWGGQIFSATNSNMYGMGLHKNTLAGRAECDAAPRNPATGAWENCLLVSGVFDEGVVIDGVDRSGQSNDGIQYTTPHSYFGRIGGSIAEEFVYDANVIYMRQLRLDYNLPSRLVSQWGLGGATVSMVARNPFIIYNPVPNIDPTVGLQRGNSQGLEMGNEPNTRSIGFSIDLRF